MTRRLSGRWRATIRRTRPRASSTSRRRSPPRASRCPTPLRPAPARQSSSTICRPAHSPSRSRTTRATPSPRSAWVSSGRSIWPVSARRRAHGASSATALRRRPCRLRRSPAMASPSPAARSRSRCRSRRSTPHPGPCSPQIAPVPSSGTARAQARLTSSARLWPATISSFPSATRAGAILSSIRQAASLSTARRPSSCGPATARRSSPTASRGTLSASASRPSSPSTTRRFR